MEMQATRSDDKIEYNVLLFPNEAVDVIVFPRMPIAVLSITK